MGRESESTPALARASHLSWPLRYGGALLAVVTGAGFWMLSSLIHRDPFAVFILGVIFTARFLGFGPAVFGTALSVVAIDYLAFEPRLSLAMDGSDVARLLIFVVISLLAASLARQRSRAEVLADQTLEEMAAIDPALEKLAQAVRGACAELVEAARELSRYAERAGGDPQRLEELDERIEVLRRLARKHGGTLASALQRRDQMRGELASLENHDEELARREAEVQRLAAVARGLAEKLSEKRRAAAGAFSKAVAQELSALGMARSEISVRFNPVAEGAIAGMGPRGLETAELLLSPNPGEELRPLSRIASGGELSRVLLAVKRVLAESDPVDAYLFDEVDAGIGGATADAVGRALAAVARRRQIICITHLPQIAVFAGKHLTVEKEVLKGRTHSRVLAVDGDDRVRELARLLSGKPTGVALEHARELLAAARSGDSRKRKAV